MDQSQPKTPPRPTIPVPPNAPKKTSIKTVSNNLKGSHASRVLVFE